jgi:hypothetical protein
MFKTEKKGILREMSPLSAEIADLFAQVLKKDAKQVKKSMKLTMGCAGNAGMIG